MTNTGGGVLILLGGATVLFLSESSPKEFMAIQALAVVIPILIYIPRIIYFSLKNIFKLSKLILNIDRDRIIRRNISYIVDMIHTPLFLMSIAGLSLIVELSWMIYLIGLALPIAFILNQMVGERARFKFGLVDLEIIKKVFNSKRNLIKTVLLSFLLFYTLSTIFIGLNVYGLIESEKTIAMIVFLQICFICISSLSGLVISKSGLEFIDLLINFVVTTVLIVIIQFDMPAVLQVLLTSLTISGKYMAQQIVAYTRLAGEFKYT